jgi:hypothetical protein
MDNEIHETVVWIYLTDVQGPATGSCQHGAPELLHYFSCRRAVVMFASLLLLSD